MLSNHRLDKIKSRTVTFRVFRCWCRRHGTPFDFEPSYFQRGSHILTSIISHQLHHIWCSPCSGYPHTDHWYYATGTFRLCLPIPICTCPGHLPYKHHLHWLRFKGLPSQVPGIFVGVLVQGCRCASRLGTCSSWFPEIHSDVPWWCIWICQPSPCLKGLSSHPSLH